MLDGAPFLFTAARHSRKAISPLKGVHKGRREGLALFGRSRLDRSGFGTEGRKWMRRKAEPRFQRNRRIATSTKVLRKIEKLGGQNSRSFSIRCEWFEVFHGLIEI